MIRSLSPDELKPLWLLGLLVLGACNQDRNRSIEVMNHGVEMGRQKLYDSAVRDLKQAVTIDPTNGQAYYNLGIVYKDQKKWSDAAQAFSEALKFDGANPALHYEIGSALLEDKKLAEAQREFESALRLDPKLYKAHFRLGVLLEKQDKVREADAEYRKAIESNPRFIPPYLRLGNLYLDNDYEKEAAQVFQNALAANDGEGEAHQGLAESLEKQKQYDEAIREFKRALDLNGDLYLASYNIGHCYRLLGDKKSAKQWLQRFVMNYSSKAGPELTKAASDEMYALDAP